MDNEAHFSASSVDNDATKTAATWLHRPIKSLLSDINKFNMKLHDTWQVITAPYVQQSLGATLGIILILKRRSYCINKVDGKKSQTVLKISHKVMLYKLPYLEKNIQILQDKVVIFGGKAML